MLLRRYTDKEPNVQGGQLIRPRSYSKSVASGIPAPVGARTTRSSGSYRLSCGPREVPRQDGVLASDPPGVLPAPRTESGLTPTAAALPLTRAETERAAGGREDPEGRSH